MRTCTQPSPHHRTPSKYRSRFERPSPAPSTRSPNNLIYTDAPSLDRFEIQPQISAGVQTASTSIHDHTTPSSGHQDSLRASTQIRRPDMSTRATPSKVQPFPGGGGAHPLTPRNPVASTRTPRPVQVHTGFRPSASPHTSNAKKRHVCGVAGGPAPSGRAQLPLGWGMARAAARAQLTPGPGLCRRPSWFSTRASDSS